MKSTDRPKWPQNRRIGKDSSWLPKIQGMQWSSDEKKTANELTRLLELFIDDHVQLVKLKNNIERIVPKSKFIEVHTRINGSKKRIEIKADNTRHQEEAYKIKALEDDIALLKEALPKQQSLLLSLVIASAQASEWKVEVPSDASERLKTYVARAKESFNSQNGADRKVEVVIAWLNNIYGTASALKEHAVAHEMTLHAERLAKARAADAAELLEENARIASGSVDVGGTPSSPRSANKRRQLEILNDAERAINNPLIQ